MPLTLTKEQIVQKLYIAYFNRPADAPGAASWLKALTGGASEATIAGGFATSPEFVTAYKDKSAIDFVIALYNNMFGRAPDKDGLNHWVGLIDSGTIKKEQMPVTLLDNMGPGDTAVITNKIAAATDFTSAFGNLVGADYAAATSAYQPSNAQATAAARAYLSAVTGDKATLDAAKAAVAGIVAGLKDAQGNGATTNTVLTANQDVLSGTAGNDFFRGVAGASIGSQDQTTLNSSDIIDGGAGDDQLIVNLTGANYQGGATIKNVETLKLGTNLAAARFDYNVNQGVNEITGVKTIVADQINVGETLTIDNVLRVTGTTNLPVLSWENDSQNKDAGDVKLNYRASEVADTETQTVKFSHIANGILDLNDSIETVVLTASVKGEQTGLLNSNNADGGSNAVAADIISAGSLTTVKLNGDGGFGWAPGVRSNGSTDRVVGSDIGGSGSDLLSVGARVTTVDATDLKGDANVRFVAKTNKAETNVTFKGGIGNDYVEFEVGNINATGGKGNDTFAFINSDFNSTFTTLDTIDGGEGSDTIQLGVNGVGSYDVDYTEFNNKKGIDTLDLRGATNKVVLSDEFVAASDAGLTVRTDRINQTSATDSANKGTTTIEDASLNTVSFVKLANNRVINFQGGSGSDRLILNENSFTSNATLSGGTNVANTAGGVATAGDYDTLTVVDNAVLSRGDLSKTSGFEGLILVKSDNTSNRQFSVELTSAFIGANTKAVDDVTTDINDVFFQIGTVAAANANALSVGDTVTIDISDLFSGTSYKMGPRKIDVTTLTNLGVTVDFKKDGVAADAAAIAAATGTDAVGQTNVIGSSPAIPAGQNVLLFTGTSGNTTSGFEIASNKIAGAGNDLIKINGLNLAASAVINGSTGTDTLELNGTVNLSAVNTAISNVEKLTLTGTSVVTETVAQHNVFVSADVTAAGTADTINLSGGGTVTGLYAAVENYTASDAQNYNITTSATGNSVDFGANLTNADTVAGGASTADIIKASAVAANALDNVTGVETVILTGAANAVTSVNALVATGKSITIDASASTGASTFVFTAETDGVINAKVGTAGSTIAMAGANNLTDTYTLGAGADVITLNAANTVANLANVDALVNFKAAGADQIRTGNAGVGTWSVTLDATTTLASFVGGVNSALALLTGYTAGNAQYDVIVVNVASGSSLAGTYVVQDFATGAGIDASARIVKLIGAGGVTAADIIA